MCLWQDPALSVAGAAGGGGGSMPAPLAFPVQRKALTAEQNELINRLVRYQEEYESPTKEDMRRSAVSTFTDSCLEGEGGGCPGEKLVRIASWRGG